MKHDMCDSSSCRLDPVARAIRLLLQALAGMAMIVLAGCRAPLAPLVPLVPLGTFASSGGLLGTWSKTSYYCASSVDADLSSPMSNVIFADSHRQWFSLATGKLPGRDIVLVNTFHPVRTVRIRSDACRRFEVRHVPQPDGSFGADVELDCDTDDGGRVTASLHAQSCR